MGEKTGTYGVLAGKAEKHVHHVEDTGVDGRIILKGIFEKWNGCMDLIDLAQERDMW